MRRLACLAAAVILAFAVTGCNLENPPSPPPAHVTGTVQDIWFRFDPNILSDLWSAQLILPSGQAYNGAPNVNLANNGSDDSCFHDFIRDGDTLSVTAASSGSFNELSASDVTVNGVNLGTYSGC